MPSWPKFLAHSCYRSKLISTLDTAIADNLLPVCVCAKFHSFKLCYFYATLTLHRLTAGSRTLKYSNRFRGMTRWFFRVCTIPVAYIVICFMVSKGWMSDTDIPEKTWLTTERPWHIVRCFLVATLSLLHVWQHICKRCLYFTFLLSRYRCLKNILEHFYYIILFYITLHYMRPVKNWVMRCWCRYLSGARCRLFAYGPADATASQNPIISCLI